MIEVSGNSVGCNCASRDIETGTQRAWHSTRLALDVRRSMSGSVSIAPPGSDRPSRWAPRRDMASTWAGPSLDGCACGPIDAMRACYTAPLRLCCHGSAEIDIAFTRQRACNCGALPGAEALADRRSIALCGARRDLAVQAVGSRSGDGNVHDRGNAGRCVCFAGDVARIKRVPYSHLIIRVWGSRDLVPMARLPRTGGRMAQRSVSVDVHRVVRSGTTDGIVRWDWCRPARRAQALDRCCVQRHGCNLCGRPTLPWEHELGHDAWLPVA
jgi:hypothetical protein